VFADRVVTAVFDGLGVLGARILKGLVVWYIAAPMGAVVASLGR
jgi:hypothetical protein